MTHSVESKVTGLSAPVAIEHGVPLYLASDEALIHILDRYPADLIDVNGCDFGEEVLAAREHGQIDGAAILAAVKTGEVWLNLRGVEQAHPGLWAEIMRSLSCLAPHIGAACAGNMTGQLIISTAGARTPYQFDPAGQVMFNLRGVKRVWVYPANETYLPQKAVEQVIMNRAGADALPYAPDYDRGAWRFDMVAGEALALPLFSPHRIENHKGLCVTLALDYQTKESRTTIAAHRANSVLRRWRLPVLAMARTSMAIRTALSILSLTFDRFGLLAPPVRDGASTVDLDRGGGAKREFDLVGDDRAASMSQPAPA